MKSVSAISARIWSSELKGQWHGRCSSQHGPARALAAAGPEPLPGCRDCHTGRSTAVGGTENEREIAFLGDEFPQVGRGVAEGGVLGELAIADRNGFPGHVGPMDVTGGKPAGLEVGGTSSTPSNPVPVTRRRAASMACISARTWPRRVESLRLTTSTGAPRVCPRVNRLPATLVVSSTRRVFGQAAGVGQHKAGGAGFGKTRGEFGCGAAHPPCRARRPGRAGVPTAPRSAGCRRRGRASRRCRANRCCSTRAQVSPHSSSPQRAARAIRRSPGGSTPNSSRSRPDEPPSSATVTTAVSVGRDAGAAPTERRVQPVAATERDDAVARAPSGSLPAEVAVQHLACVEAGLAQAAGRSPRSSRRCGACRRCSRWRRS